MNKLIFTLITMFIASVFSLVSEAQNNQVESCLKYFENKDYKKTISCLNELSKKINDRNVFYYLGESYYETNDFENAKDNYLKAISLQKNDTLSYIMLGTICFTQEKYEDALKYLKEAKKICKDLDRDIDRLIAEILVILGKPGYQEIYNSFILDAELHASKQFGFTKNMLGLSKNEILQINKDSKKIEAIDNFDIAYSQNNKTEIQFQFNWDNKCISVIYSKPDDKKYDDFYYIKKSLNMEEKPNKSGYFFDALEYHTEVYWSKVQGANYQRIVYLFSNEKKKVDKNDLNFGLWNSNSITDIEGNLYHTITIGTQTWMVENLKTIKYNNGDKIPNITDNDMWSKQINGAYCDYSNNPLSADTYGHLYNWYVVNDKRNVCPNGSHVPTDAEWSTLINYLGGKEIAGGKMKVTSIKTFNPENTNDDDLTGDWEGSSIIIVNGTNTGSSTSSGHMISLKNKINNNYSCTLLGFSDSPISTTAVYYNSGVLKINGLKNDLIYNLKNKTLSIVLDVAPYKVNFSRSTQTYQTEKYWVRESIGATNSSGFSGFPGGYRSSAYDGKFQEIKSSGSWWSASETDENNASNYWVSYTNAGIARSLFDHGKKGGHNIRCIIDNSNIQINSLNNNDEFQKPKEILEKKYAGISSSFNLKWTKLNDGTFKASGLNGNVSIEFEIKNNSWVSTNCQIASNDIGVINNYIGDEIWKKMYTHFKSKCKTSFDGIIITDDSNGTIFYINVGASSYEYNGDGSFIKLEEGGD